MAPRPSAADELEPLLNIEEAARVLGTSVRHMRRLVAEHDLPAVRLGGLLRFEPADLRAYRRVHRSPAR